MTQTTTTEQTPAPERFKIDSEDAANWLLKKLAGIEAERNLIKAQAKKRDEELKADYDGLLSRFGSELRAWAREEANRRRRQGVTLMYGTLAFRAQAARFTIESEPDALTTAKLVCPSAVTVETSEKFDRDTFLTYAEGHFASTGEILPGTDRTPEGEAFAIRFPSSKETP